MIRRVIIYCIILCCAIFSVLLFLFNTERGTQWAFILLTKGLRQQLHIEQVNGVLNGTVVLHHITYRDTEMQLQLEQLQLTWQALHLLLGKITIKNLQLQNVALQLYDNQTADNTSANFFLPLQLEVQHATLNKLDLKLASMPKSAVIHDIRLSGRTALNTKKPNLQLHLAWKAATWPISTSNNVTTQFAEIFLTGNPAAYQLQSHTQLAGDNIPSGIWQIQGQGSAEQFALTQLNGKTLHGNIQATGQIQWTDKNPAWSFIISGEHLNPGIKWPKLPGNINFNFATQGKLQPGKMSATVDLPNLSGKLQQYPIHGKLHLAVQDKKFSLTTAQFEIGDNIFLHAVGNLDQNWNLQWQAKINNIAKTFLGSSGNFDSQGSITGASTTPHIVAFLNGKNLNLFQNRLGQVRGHANIRWEPQARSELQLSATQLKIADYPIQQLQLQANGTYQQHQLQFMLQAPKQKLLLALTGHWDQQTWLAQIQTLNLDSAILGHWQLQQAARLAVSKSYSELKSIDWRSINNQQIQLQGTWQEAKPSTISFTAKNISLQPLQTLLSPQIKIQGKASATATLQIAANKQFSGETAIQLQPSRLFFTVDGKFHALAHITGELTAQLHQHGLAIQSLFELSKQNTLNAQIAMPNYLGLGLPDAQQNITGAIQGKFSDLSLLALLIPQLRNPQGYFALDSQLQGTLAKPIIIGKAKLINGSTELPPLGIKVNALSLQAVGKKNGIIDFSGSGKSGAGNINLTGQTQLAGNGYPTNLSIQGRDFEAYHTRDYQIVASPHLQLTMKQNQLHLTGNIDIPQATLAPVDYSQQSIVTSDDVVLVNQQRNSEQTTPFNFYSHINLQLGNQVTLNAMGLQGKLTGKLTITDSPNALTIGTGEITLQNGIYNAYGQKLAIRNGRLIFAGGPINNPGLDLQAIRQVSSTQLSNTISGSETTQHVVGVNVQGTVKKPQISLFAEPADLAQTDILSYLIIGRPSNDASSADAQLLLKAASALSGGGGEFERITRQLQESLGLDTLNVESSSQYNAEANAIEENTSLVLGKALSPRLFINYSIGLINPVNTLKIRYLLSSKWTLQTQTSSMGNGVDLFYTIEKN